MIRFFHIRNCDSTAVQRIIIRHCRFALERVTAAPSANDFPFERATHTQPPGNWLGILMLSILGYMAAEEQ